MVLAAMAQAEGVERQAQTVRAAMQVLTQGVTIQAVAEEAVRMAELLEEMTASEVATTQAAQAEMMAIAVAEARLRVVTLAQAVVVVLVGIQLLAPAARAVWISFSVVRMVQAVAEGAAPQGILRTRTLLATRAVRAVNMEGAVAEAVLLALQEDRVVKVLSLLPTPPSPIQIHR